MEAQFNRVIDILQQNVEALLKVLPTDEKPASPTESASLENLTLDAEAAADPEAIIPLSDLEVVPSDSSPLSPTSEAESEQRQHLPPQLTKTNITHELQEVHALLEQQRSWIEKMPPERMRSTLMATMRGLTNTLSAAVEHEILTLDQLRITEETGQPLFLQEAAMALGIEVSISNDRMTASVCIPRDMASLWSPSSVEANLAEQGVKFGIGQSALESLFRKKRFDSFVPIARGKNPVPGKSAWLEDCLKLKDISGKPQELTQVKVDMKELNLFHPVTEGQVVMRKTPCVPGEPGINVCEEEIPCLEGVDINLPSLPNTRVSEDGLELLSTVNGCAYLQGDQIVVTDALTLPRGVNYATGNVKTGVSVMIVGDVQSGFKVESGQDIVVKGVVETAELIAKGKILVDGGVEGGTLKSGQSIEVKFQNGGSAEAPEGSFIAHGPVTQCHIKARQVVVDGNSGHIIGGKIEAWDNVTATIIGSDIGVKTEIVLGGEVESLTAELEELRQSIEQREAKLQQFAKALTGLEKLQEKLGGTLPKEKEHTLITVKKGLPKLEAALNKLKEKQEKLQTDLNTSQTSQRAVQALEGIHAGVVITIRGATETYKIPLQGATIVEHDGELLNQTGKPETESAPAAAADEL